MGNDLSLSKDAASEESRSTLEEYERILGFMLPIMKDYVEKCSDRSGTVVDYCSGKDLENILSLDLPEEPRDLSALGKIMEENVKHWARTGHAYFMDKLYAGSDPIGVVGELFTALANTNIHTFRVAPVFSVMEVNVIRQMCEICGFKNGDGVFCPGGSYANMLAMLVARNMRIEGSRLDGIQDQTKLVVFTSEQGHYSASRAAMVLGFGMRGAVPVKTHDGMIIPEELEKEIVKAIDEGKKPFFVNATAGTTVLGAFDPFREMGKICKKYGIWFHIDGCLGGSMIMTNTHRHLLDGLEMADSFSWNPHKLMGVPLQCSALLMNDHPKDLVASCASKADYLFHDGDDHAFDLGDKTLQCGRHIDVFKLWLSWNYHGSVGFRNRLEKATSNAKYLAEQVGKRDGFRLYTAPMSTNVCFWYIPKKFRGVEDVESSLSMITSVICERIQKSGRMLIDFAPLPGDVPTMIRVVCNSPKLNPEDMDVIIDTIEQIGEELFE